jgi:pSer/pThr/pTyr-binding forkhead associated (FHA) protein
MVSDRTKKSALLGWTCLFLLILAGPDYPRPAGEYTCLLTLERLGNEVNAQRVFSHIIAEATPWWKEWSKSQIVWGIVALALIIVGIAVVYRSGLLRKEKAELRHEGAESKELPEVSVMIRKKFHPPGLSPGPNQASATVALPISSKGEVGLEIDVGQPLPLTFALVDRRSRREYGEVVITRYDDERDHLFSEERIYLVLSDRSVTRPSDERQGHARIFMDKRTGTYQIEDLGSTSGTLVNGKILKKGIPLALIDGDSIMVGRVTLKYFDRRPLLETHF